MVQPSRHGGVSDADACLVVACIELLRDSPVPHNHGDGVQRPWWQCDVQNPREASCYGKRAFSEGHTPHLLLCNQPTAPHRQWNGPHIELDQPDGFWLGLWGKERDEGRHKMADWAQRSAKPTFLAIRMFSVSWALSLYCISAPDFFVVTQKSINAVFRQCILSFIPHNATKSHPPISASFSIIDLFVS